MNDWRDLAACKDRPSSMFFGEGDSGPATYDNALAVCGRCGVSEECLEYALANKIEYGVWGAQTPRQRGVRSVEYRSLTCAECGLEFRWASTRGYSPPKYCGAPCRNQSMSTEVKHGRVSTYRHGCRCEHCRRAGKAARLTA